MTKNIESINSKGVMNNKSLYSIIHTNLKLPSDPYLFPSLGVNVRDNLFSMFSFTSMNWGNFDVDLIKYTSHYIYHKIKTSNYK